MKFLQGYYDLMLLGGLLNSLMLYPFMQRGTLNNVNLDTVTTVGMYRIGDDGSAFANSTIIVFGKKGEGLVQMYINYVGNSFKMRSKWYELSWGTWRSVSLT